MTHRIVQWVVALAVGVFLALVAYQRATDPEPAAVKAFEEQLVTESRLHLTDIVLPGGTLQIVDPLAPDRLIGKTYVWPNEAGWQVSGHYRRDPGDTWHPYLMQFDANRNLLSVGLKDSDAALAQRAAEDKRIKITPDRSPPN